MLAPQNYSVIATLNLNGDYISDALAAQVGGIGIAPGANMNFLTGHACLKQPMERRQDLRTLTDEPFFSNIERCNDAGLYELERSRRTDN